MLGDPDFTPATTATDHLLIELVLAQFAEWTAPVIAPVAANLVSTTAEGCCRLDDEFAPVRFRHGEMNDRVREEFFVSAARDVTFTRFDMLDFNGQIVDGCEQCPQIACRHAWAGIKRSRFAYQRCACLLAESAGVAHLR